MHPSLLLLASCRVPHPPGGHDDTGPGRDSAIVDSAPVDDSTLPFDSEDSGGDDDPFFGMGWVCTVERVRLDAIGLVGLWGDPDSDDAIAADGNGAVFGWSGSTWDYVGGLDHGAIAIDGGDDGAVWVIGFREAFVRQGSVWSRLELQEISGASPVAVNVNAFDDVTILESGTDPGCSDCTDARNYVVHFDGYEWSVGEDPDYGRGAASGLAALSDGSILVVGSQGYARLVEHGTWTSLDLGTSTSLRAVAELSDHSVLIAADGGVLFAGTAELGFERIRTEWEGDLFAVASDGVGGAWVLGEGETWDTAHLLHWSGKRLVELGSSGPWSAFGTGPDGALRVAGGTQGAVIAAGADLSIEWSLDGIAPVADIAVADDGVAYGAANGYRNGVVGVYDGEWRAVDLGDIRAITEVETLSDGTALFVTDDANAWQWDGTTAIEEELPIDGIGHYVSAFAAGTEIAAATGTWYDQGENRDAMLEVRDATGTWSDVDLAVLPGDWMFALAIDEAGTVWMSGYDGGYAYLASWTESGAEVVVPKLESGAFGLWPKAGGGLWVLLQGDPDDDGFYAFDGTSFALELTGVELGGVRDVVEHPTLGTLAAVTYDEGTKDPGPAIAVRGKDGTWSPVALVNEEIQSLAVLPDESILAGTWQGALRLSDCAWH